ncbi:MAG TPA: DUF885 family protein, partial [Thermoanaerobaculia bacterium]|nr:DUF885 family protein [Thermoanaerobaculia bacterium]
MCCHGAAVAAMAVLLGVAPHAHSQKSQAPSPKPSSPPTRTPKKSTLSKTAEFAALRSEYLKEFFERFPVVATYLGAEGLDPAYAALDGRLRDYSPAALHAERDSWTDFQTRLAKIKVKTLPEPDRIDASMMDSQLAFLVHNLDRRVHEKALDVFLEEPLRGAEWTLQGMTPGTGGARGTKAEWQAVAARTAAVAAYLKTALANVRRGTSGNAIPDRRLITAALDAAESTAVYFEKALPEKAASWGAGLDAETRATLTAACPAAAAAFRDFRKGLVDLFFEPDGKALRPSFDRDRFAAGEAEYSWALKNNLGVTRTPRELHAYGK